MENVSQEEQQQAIASMKSTIRKSENALVNMTQKSANTMLLNKRLSAFKIGLAVLEQAWNSTPDPQSYTVEQLSEARHILLGLQPSLENMYEKSKVGSPQRTLLERRLRAFQLAIQAIDQFS